MKYLDTNVLVRIITGDDQALAEQGLATIERAGQGEFCVVDAVLVELCFILEFHSYRMTRGDIANALETLLDAPQLTVAEPTKRALALYRDHPKLDYADCLLFALGGKQGVVTFDQDLRQELLA